MRPLVAVGVSAMAMLFPLAGACGSPSRAESGQQSALVPPVTGGTTYGAALSKRWHDGKAELAGYSLRFPRYGQLRTGKAVTIFVTEPLSTMQHVKPERPNAASLRDGSVVNVMKLNLVQDFQTGIYDYNMMTSAFVALGPWLGRPAGSMAKVSFSSQEWCGHVYAQARFAKKRIAIDSHSYFEGEADEQTDLDYPEGGLSEDALMLWARGMAGPALAPGTQARVPLLRSLQRVRLQHVALKWDNALLSRGSDSRTLTVPAGSFATHQYQAQLQVDGKAGPRWTFDVEAAFPHRIIRFARDDGLTAELRGEARLPYWQLHDEGHEKHLHALGL